MKSVTTTRIYTLGQDDTFLAVKHHDGSGEIIVTNPFKVFEDEPHIRLDARHIDSLVAAVNCLKTALRTNSEAASQ